MFLSYQVIATFGVSALLSFTLSTLLLLGIAAKRGLLRVGNKPKGGQVLLPPPRPQPIIAELQPLKNKM